MLQDGAEIPAIWLARLFRCVAQPNPAIRPTRCSASSTTFRALHEGNGDAEGRGRRRRWFEAAAAGGQTRRHRILRTGYHVGDRDGSTWRRWARAAAGVQTSPLPGELQEQARAAGGVHGPGGAAGRRLSQTPASPPVAAPAVVAGGCA